MSTRVLYPFLALPLMLGVDAAPAPGQASKIDRLKSLAGEWSIVDPAGSSTGLRASYRVIAGGAAVLETLFPGAAEETVTVYHLDEGNRVTVTQVGRRAAPLRFAPVGGSSSDVMRFETADEQPSVLQLTIEDDERMRIAWLPTAEPPIAFDLQRSSSVTELATEVSRLRVSLDSIQAELDRRIKREVTVARKGEPTRTLLETRTLPDGPGWNVTGVPFSRYLHEQTQSIATTFASQGDKGMTVGHYAFVAGPACRLRFAVIGGHGYVTVVEETKAPPRRIRDIPDFSVDLMAGAYGQPIERIVGGQWKEPRSVEWDLSRFAGKTLRLYVVDAETNHYGQVGISEVSILESSTE